MTTPTLRRDGKVRLSVQVTFAPDLEIVARVIAQNFWPEGEPPTRRTLKYALRDYLYLYGMSEEDNADEEHNQEWAREQALRLYPEFAHE